MSILDWIVNRLPSEQRKNVAFHTQLDGIMSEMRRDVCVGCGHRAGEPYEGGGCKPTMCCLCRDLLELKCHPRIPDYMCDTYLELWGTPEAVEAFLENAHQRENTNGLESNEK